MEWAEYYDKFYDWANSTQISRISQLTSYGAADEVCEVAIELCDDKAATRLIKQAVASGVTFNSSQIIDLMDALNEDGMNCVVASTKSTFTREQIDDLYGAASDDILEEAAAKSGIDYFGDNEADYISESDETAHDDFPETEPQPKIGFFAQLAIALGVASSLDKEHKKHSGHCDGDCAHCPPHYGYRYGRWYYGHHHQYGCELGGNKGL